MAEIHIFSGLGSSIVASFRSGTNYLEKIIDELPSEADAKTHIWNNWDNVYRDILRKKINGTLEGPIILVGHSNGVFACMMIAEKLKMHNVKVDYIGSIDATLKAFPEAGWNVDFIHDFHATRGMVALGRRMSKGKRATVLPNKKFKGELKPIRVSSGHVAASSNLIVIKTISEKVKELIT